MQFEYDPERLIEEVKNRPAIWDFDHEEYRNKEVKHRLWGEIIQGMMQSDVKISKSQKRELELQLHKKWKSIRDCYQKYLQNPNRTRRPYLYYKQLKFLSSKSKNSEETEQQPLEQTDQQNDNDNEGETSDSEEEKKASRLWKPKRVFKLVKNEDNSDDDNDTSMQHYPDTAYLNACELEVHVPPKMRRVTNQMEEFAFANTDSRSDGEDTDKMFLLSLLPHLKAIPEESRLEAKMDMMKVLRNAK